MSLIWMRYFAANGHAPAPLPRRADPRRTAWTQRPGPQAVEDSRRLSERCIIPGLGRRRLRELRVKRNVVLLCQVPSGRRGRASKVPTLEQAKALLSVALGSRRRRHEDLTSCGPDLRPGAARRSPGNAMVRPMIDSHPLGHSARDLGDQAHTTRQPLTGVSAGQGLSIDGGRYWV